MSIELKQAPAESISSLCYAPSQSRNVLVCTAWDKTLRVYDADNNEQLAQQDFSLPLLDASFLSDASRVAAGGLSKSLFIFDVATQKVSTLPTVHRAAIKNCRFHRPTNLLYTSGWDGVICAWDVRSAGAGPVAQAQLHGKAFAMDLNDTYLIAADSKKRTYLYDIRQGPQGLSTPEMRDQVLKYQVRCIRCFPNGTGFAASSIEGRVAWEYFDTAHFALPAERQLERKMIVVEDDREWIYPVSPGRIWDWLLKQRRIRVFEPLKAVGLHQFCVATRTRFPLQKSFFTQSPEVQSKKYAFKCHRIKEARGSETACPVNALSFHPRYGTFATGGSDGGVSVWDGQSKKRLWRLPPFPTSIAALAFNPSGNQLAIGVSYLYEKGPMPTAPPPQVVVRLVKDEDVRPKALAAAA